MIDKCDKKQIINEQVQTQKQLVLNKITKIECSNFLRKTM